MTADEEKQQQVVRLKSSAHSKVNKVLLLETVKPADGQRDEKQILNITKLMCEQKHTTVADVEQFVTKTLEEGVKQLITPVKDLNIEEWREVAREAKNSIFERTSAEEAKARASTEEPGTQRESFGAVPEGTDSIPPSQPQEPQTDLPETQLEDALGETQKMPGDIEEDSQLP